MKIFSADFVARQTLTMSAKCGSITASITGSWIFPLYLAFILHPSNTYVPMVLLNNNLLPALSVTGQQTLNLITSYTKRHLVYKT